MKKLSISVSTIIVTHFVMKVVRKLKRPEQITKEEAYQSMRDAREEWLRTHNPKRPIAEVNDQLMRGDPRAALASIGTVYDL